VDLVLIACVACCLVFRKRRDARRLGKCVLIKRRSDIPYSAVTPKELYTNRRRFLADVSATVLGATAAGILPRIVSLPSKVSAATKLSTVVKSPFSTNETQTPYKDVTHYNNFYEFGTTKEAPAERAKDFQTSPWSVSVEGAVSRPGAYDLESLMKLAPLEERIYRHRCVEGWSIVVPWIGFPLSTLIRQVEPTVKAKFVAFQSFYDTKQMPVARYA